VNSAEQAMQHAIALAGTIATVSPTRQTMIITTSVSMCEKVGSILQEEFSG
jgi:hypothetical protein